MPSPSTSRKRSLPRKKEEPAAKIRVKRIVKTEFAKMVYVPRPIIKKTTKYLRRYGKQHYEGLLFWSGIQTASGDAFVTTCIYPRITSCSAGHARMDAIPGAEVVSETRRRGLIVLAQIHSHPGSAFHSGTDNCYPFVFSEGFFSIVVPYFGKKGMEPLWKCRIYRYGRDEKWHELVKKDIERTFLIVDQEVCLGK
ncbi:MAG: Mov34/MPN/PAD-1 family protein [Candidatus Bathyarchaeota archaeon]|nr:Mov34/MPN/PAD-1 family protein [Candidatus Bathyarchaeota archaeon]